LKRPSSLAGLNKIPSDRGRNSSFVCIVMLYRFRIISGIVTWPFEVILLNSVCVSTTSRRATCFLGSETFLEANSYPHPYPVRIMFLLFNLHSLFKGYMANQQDQGDVAWPISQNPGKLNALLSQGLYRSRGHRFKSGFRVSDRSHISQPFPRLERVSGLER